MMELKQCVNKLQKKANNSWATGRVRMAKGRKEPIAINYVTPYTSLPSTQNTKHMYKQVVRALLT